MFCFLYDLVYIFNDFLSTPSQISSIMTSAPNQNKAVYELIPITIEIRERERKREGERERGREREGERERETTAITHLMHFLSR